ncbi:MAG: hypothetical protein OXH34_03455 [Bacteroidetes bacterium]|nr:hypothetical protein [Bacteroidota bacterium]
MQRLGFLFGLILFLAVLASCETEQQALELTEEDLAELVPYVSLGRGVQASLDTTTTRMISEPSIWLAYTDSLRPLLPFTSVDFEMEMVLLAAVDVNSGGYDLRFESVESLRDTVVATYRLFSPGTDCRPSYAPGVPFEAIRIPRTHTAVRFVRVDEAVDCAPS